MVVFWAACPVLGSSPPWLKARMRATTVTPDSIKKAPNNKVKGFTSYFLKNYRTVNLPNTSFLPFTNPCPNISDALMFWNSLGDKRS